MASEMGNQSLQSSQATESNNVRSKVVLAYPAESLNIAGNIPGKRPVKVNKDRNIDQPMGYLD